MNISPLPQATLPESTSTQAPSPQAISASAARPAVLILGANGRFGLAAAQAFDAAGWRVLAQIRRDAVPAMPPRATLLRTALTDTDALVDAFLKVAAVTAVPNGAGNADPNGHAMDAAAMSTSARAQTGGAALPSSVRVVIHAVNPIYTRWDTEAMPALEAGLRVAQRLKAHFMLPGNVYNFGEAMPPLLTETTPFAPTTPKGTMRVAMEALIARAAFEGGFTASVIRAGDFLGPGTGNWFDQAIVKSMRAGKLVYPGPLNLPHAWAYLPDLARAFVLVASLQAPATFKAWHFEGHTLTGHLLIDAIEDAARALGISPPSGFRVGSMPWGLIRAIGRVYPLWRELARMSYLWRLPHALDGRALAALSGHAPSVTPLPVALRACLVALGHGASARHTTVRSHFAHSAD